MKRREFLKSLGFLPFVGLIKRENPWTDFKMGKANAGWLFYCDKSLYEKLLMGDLEILEKGL